MKPKDRARLKRLESLQPLAGAGSGGVTPNPSWFQSTWFIDPQNSTGRASDGNTGLTALTPVLTWNGGVVRKYGTQSPFLAQSTSWTFLSASPDDGSDPIVFTPIMIKGAQPLFQGPLGPAQKIGSGVIAGFSPKNYGAFGAGGHLPSANLGPLAAVGQFIINTTPGKASASWVRSNLGGTTFDLYQPVARTTHDSSVPPPFVDTWANGDAFDLFQPVGVEFVKYAPIWGDFTATTDNNRAFVQNLVIRSVTGGPTQPFAKGAYVCMLECRCDRRMTLLDTTYTTTSFSANSVWTNALGITGGSFLSDGTFRFVIGARGEIFYAGGGTVANSNAIFDGNFAFEAYNGAASYIQGCGLGTICLEAPLLVTGDTIFGQFAYDQARCWGPGLYEQANGRCRLSDNTAVNVFIMQSLEIAGLTTAFSATTANPSVIDGNVAVTPAAIDAADVGGVGLFNPTGGSISIIPG